jgi:hypothetical protein
VADARVALRNTGEAALVEVVPYCAEQPAAAIDAAALAARTIQGRENLNIGGYLPV